MLLLVTVVCATLSLSFAQRAATATPPAATARAVEAGEAFLATLDPAARAKANIALNDKTRTIWSNLPSGITMQVGARERNGLKLGDMTPVQEKAALALLAATLSAEGFEKVMAIVEADQALEVASAPSRPAAAPIRFGRAEYYLSILGKPSLTTPWMIQFGGHHLGVNITLGGRWNVLAPTHTGTQPARFELAGREIRPLGDESDKAFALMSALGPDAQKAALLSYEVRNLVLGPGTDGRTIAPEGVAVSTFNPAQRALLLDLVHEWVGILGDEAAAAKMKDIEAGLAGTWFAWAGPMAAGRGAYFRIQGPSVLIEYAPQGQGANNIDHIHTIYREPMNDYGARVIR
jgi:hypothetical protein